MIFVNYCNTAVMNVKSGMDGYNFDVYYVRKNCRNQGPFDDYDEIPLIMIDLYRWIGWEHAERVYRKRYV